MTFEQLGALLEAEWLPAWVQAIGSILAIASAAALIFVQHSLECAARDQLELETRKRKYASLKGLIAAFHDDIERKAEFVARHQVDDRWTMQALIKNASDQVAGYRDLLVKFDYSFVDIPMVWYAAAQLLGHVGGFNSAAGAIALSVEKYTSEEWKATGKDGCIAELVDILEHVRARAGRALRVIEEQADV